MLNKLKKYHRDYEIAQNKSTMKKSEDINYFGYSTCFELGLNNKTLAPVYSDNNGIYDISLDRILAFYIDEKYNKIWNIYLW